MCLLASEVPGGKRSGLEAPSPPGSSPYPEGECPYGHGPRVKFASFREEADPSRPGKRGWRGGGVAIWVENCEGPRELQLTPHFPGVARVPPRQRLREPGAAEPRERACSLRGRGAEGVLRGRSDIAAPRAARAPGRDRGPRSPGRRGRRRRGSRSRTGRADAGLLLPAP